MLPPYATGTDIDENTELRNQANAGLEARLDKHVFDADMDDTATITAERMNCFLFAFLFDPQIDADPEGAWNFRWNTPVDDEVITRQLESLLNAIMQSPEYQLF